MVFQMSLCRGMCSSFYLGSQGIPRTTGTGLQAYPVSSYVALWDYLCKVQYLENALSPLGNLSPFVLSRIGMSLVFTLAQ